MQNGGLAAATDMSNRFEQRIAETARLLPPVEGAAFRQRVDTERGRLLDEYSAGPIAFKNLLGIAMGYDAVAASVPYRSHSGHGLGDLVARTTIRATIWESIWALFRLGR